MATTFNGTERDRLVVDSAGNVGIGTTAPLAPLHIVSGGTTSAGYFDLYSGGATAPAFFPMVFRTARGTSVSPTVLKTDDYLFALGGRGYNGTAFTSTANVAITGHAAEDWTASKIGTYLRFDTTPIGSTTRTEKMRILGNGDVGIGTISPNAKLDVNGSLNQTNGNATINMIYGEMYCKNDTGCGVVDLVTPDVYVIMNNQTAGNINGFTLNSGTNLTAHYSGMYKVDAKVAISDGAPSGEYGMKLYINETGQDNCYDHFHIGADQISMVITCLVRINVGQNVSIRFDDRASPVSDLTIYASNLNLVRVGN